MVTVRGAGVIETETMTTTKETREKETNTGHRRVWGGGRRGSEWGVNARISQIQVCTSENSSWGTLHHAAKGLTFGQSCRGEIVKHLKSVRRGRCDDGPEKAFLYCGRFSVIIVPILSSGELESTPHQQLSTVLCLKNTLSIYMTE